MNILGISAYYHDASAALIQGGRITAALEEERLSRRKHDSRFPEGAIRACLELGGISIDELDLICFYEKPLLKLERVLQTAKRFGLGEMGRQSLRRALEEQLVLKEVLKTRLGYQGALEYVDHHLAHASSAWYPSRFKRAAVLTIDGVGEWATTALFLGEQGRLQRLREIRYPHSLGLFYSALTAFLGFKVNNDEYKVMGLASYGEPRYRREMERLLKLNEDGSYHLNLEYFDFMAGDKLYSPAMLELLGAPRIPESDLDQRHQDLAASVQEILEEAVLGLARAAHRETGADALCMAGGVALNCVSNARLLCEGPFREVWVQPAAGDGGGALGAALWAAQRHGEPLPPGRYSCRLGPSWKREEIRQLLEREGLSYEELEEEALWARCAQLLSEGMILGNFQGRMEFGPRALGGRSILADPRRAEMKKILNARVKFREAFRPFAPAIPAERAGEWFELEGESPYMLFAPRVREGVAARLPSVTHVDGTARVQTVTAEDHPRFHALLRAWEEQTGVPVLLNTSFNVRGEPIVCTPQEALSCFLKTDIDLLVIDNFLVEKIL